MRLTIDTRTSLTFLFCLLSLCCGSPALAMHSHAHASKRTLHLRPAAARGRAHGHTTTAVRRLRARARWHGHLETAHVEARHAVIPEQPLRRVPNLPPLRGSYASLVRQNERTVGDGLQRIADDAMLAAMLGDHQLVALPVGSSLAVNASLPANRRYCRPWTAEFLRDLSRAHAARFGRPLQVNSAVRTVAFQRSLQRINGNAAAADGDVASPHLTGATIDLAKKGLSPAEVEWMRAYLMPLQAAGKIDVEEEFYQSCFHITVYRSYVPGENPMGVRSASLLAARIQ
jgi:hypothetical protein